MQITDHALNGSTIWIEENDTHSCEIQSQDFFDFVAEDKGYIHDASRRLITIPESIPVIDKARAQVTYLSAKGDVLEYSDFFYEFSKEIESLLTRYLEAIDPAWEELEGEGEEATYLNDYRLWRKEMSM